MKRISILDIPNDYHYYRSYRDIFCRFEIRNYQKSRVLVQQADGCGYILHFLWGLFSLAVFEKSNISPTRELLSKYGMKRGLILWSGFHKEYPDGNYWFSLGYIITRKFQHSTRSAFSILDKPEYWNKWCSNARGHRRKILESLEKKEFSMNTQATWQEFKEAYMKVKVPHSYRRYFIRRQEYFMEKSPESFRIFLAYKNDIPYAGAIFFDDNVTSTYLIAFQNPEGKKLHLGLALIDAWFSDSQKKGFKYLDFDHMRDILDSPSYSGYTKFKSEIADYDVRFPKMWIKVLF